MDSFLTVVTRFKGKQSLSCNDLTAIDEYDNFDTIKQLSKDSKDKSWPRFFKPKSTGSSDESINSKNCSEIANTFDNQLAEIREKLAMFRQQDNEFHKRMRSLSNSIGDLAASRSSLNSFTHSEASDLMSGSNDDSDHKEQNNTGGITEDSRVIKATTGNLATSSTSKVVDSVPTIKVTGSYKRKRSSRRSLRRSDPAIHESARLLNSSMESNEHEMLKNDHVYFYGSAEEISTLL